MSEHETGDRPAPFETFEAPAVTLAEGGSGDRVTETPLERGDKLGRYVVLDRLGVGGMGVVYAAYDPELDRRVAIKLLDNRHHDEGRREGAQARLLREAQALARLSHPNVIAVHDVGTFRARVFVAMAFVDGWTTTAWVELERRTWREIVDVFVAAGRGLAAAHHAGLIHRDFKPDNVMVRRDGRVVVLDFGLARQAAEAADVSGPIVVAPAGDVSASGSHGGVATLDDLGLSSPGSLDVSLTRTGGVLGTPAYMSPEQHIGIATDARADQFAFCVTLYQLLYGERPFSGESAAALAFNVTHGKLREAPVGSDVPAWVRRVLVRGLAADRDRRYPSMNALLAELERDPGATGRRWALVSAAAITVAAGGFGLATVADGAKGVCGDARGRLLGVWDDERRTSVAASFAATQKSYADDSLREVNAALDRYTSSWAEMRTDACEATHVRGDQSAALMDLRMLCLDRSLAQVAALVDVLIAADATTVEQSVAATLELPSLAACADADGLLAGGSHMGPELRARVAAFDAMFARTKALRDAGKFQEAKQTIVEVVEGARALRHEASLARALMLQAGFARIDRDMEAARSAYEEAISLADVGRDDRTRARAIIRLVELLADHEAADRAIDGWIKLAEGVVQRVGDDPELEARLSDGRARVARRRSDLGAAETHARRALELRESVFGPEHVELADSLFELGAVYFDRGDYAQARDYHGRALELEERHLGREHPSVSRSLNSLANIDLTQERHADAIARYERVKAIDTLKFGPGHPALATVLNNIGITYEAMQKFDQSLAALREGLEILETKLGPDDAELSHLLENLGNTYSSMRKFDEAREFYARARKIKTAKLGADHPDVGSSIMNTARTYFFEGDYARAERMYQQTVEIWTAKLGKDHPYLGLVLTNLGDVAERRGRYQAGLEFYERAIELYEPAFGKEHGEVAYALGGVGMCQHGLGRSDEAIATLERALEMQRKNNIEPGAPERIQFALARAVYRADRKRGLELARAARDGYARDLPDAPEIGRIDAWLASRS